VQVLEFTRWEYRMSLEDYINNWSKIVIVYWYEPFLWIRVCIAYSDCQSISTDECSDCVTGNSSCTYEKPTCWKRGICHGLLIEEVSSLKILKVVNLSCRIFAHLATLLTARSADSKDTHPSPTVTIWSYGYLGCLPILL
jgi:hypothetical protein